MDKDGILEKVLKEYGFSKTYTVVVKRVKKSLDRPSTAWSVVHAKVTTPFTNNLIADSNEN